MSNPNIKKGFVLNNQSESILTFGDALAELGKCGGCGCDGDLGFHSLMDISSGVEQNIVIRDGALEVYDNVEAMKVWLKESCLAREAGDSIPGFAQGTLRAVGLISNGDQITIGGITYTFVTVFEDEPYTITEGGPSSSELSRLAAAINEPTHPFFYGLSIGTGTVAHPNVDAAMLGVLTVTAKIGGSAGNSIVTTTTSAGLSWDDPTLTGG